MSFVLRKIVELAVEKLKDVYICFIDYSKPFDTMKHRLLVEPLQSLNIDNAHMLLLTNLY